MNYKANIAIITVITFSAVFILTLTTINFVGNQNRDIGSQKFKNMQLSALGNACIEEALIRLKNDSKYKGAVLNSQNQQCTIEIKDSKGTKEITVTSKEGETYNKKWLITGKIQKRRTANNITIISWEEKE